ncbi:hypothetical protein SNOG_13361 [Parastagonospora nodorum SN15]|uniref:Uncharacterized protein n=1 Tax=Phaeosphaeria nodorum (strain SN15 / ATCC MYA-4574 / FGSC 10173) TaxID=321614 RepID=Q0U4F3_PHANO|nr:hypothetical protein SNOG_13361 [Parastagonospora nodorum SN15]EAT79245.1 hypothetical protein SNOG_13361 [Parastagonospora nodorum SN15]
MLTLLWRSLRHSWKRCCAVLWSQSHAEHTRDDPPVRNQTDGTQGLERSGSLVARSNDHIDSRTHAHHSALTETMYPTYKTQSVASSQQDVLDAPIQGRNGESVAECQAN